MRGKNKRIYQRFIEYTLPAFDLDGACRCLIKTAIVMPYDHHLLPW
ncbi:hypothetical protein [Bremerella cremea]